MIWTPCAFAMLSGIALRAALSLMPMFGPDTSAGILPMLHVLVYYAIFPLGLECSLGAFGFSSEFVPSGWLRPISALLQVAYAQAP